MLMVPLAQARELGQHPRRVRHEAGGFEDWHLGAIRAVGRRTVATLVASRHKDFWFGKQPLDGEKSPRFGLPGMFVEKPFSTSQLSSVETTAKVDVDFGIGKLPLNIFRVHLWVVHPKVEDAPRGAWRRPHDPVWIVFFHKGARQVFGRHVD